MRETYFPNDILKDISGRLRYGAVPYEDHIAKIKVPEPPHIRFPPHPNDEIAALFGMRGLEYSILMEEAAKAAGSNDLIKRKITELLMVSKLYCSEALERAKRQERSILEAKQKSDRQYQGKLREYEGRKKSISKSWTEVRSTIKTRWGRILKSLSALLERDASLKSMDPRDRALIYILSNRGHLVIRENRVEKVEWVQLQDYSVEDINEVIQDLNRDPAGGFLKTEISEYEVIDQN